MGTEKLTTIKKVSLTNQVVDSLRESIVRGDLPPGAHLAETSLATRLGVSRGSLREAFVQLEAEGLVESHVGRGVFVPELSAVDVTEIYGLRTVLEKEAMSLFVPRASADDTRRLESLAADMDRADAQGESGSIVRLNFAYHETIWRGAGNSRLHGLLRTLYHQVQLYLASAMQLQTPQRRSRSLREHHDMADAVQRGDVQRAVETMHVHLEEAEVLVKDFLSAEAGG